MQNLSVFPRWHSRPPLTTTIYILQNAYIYLRLFPPSFAFAIHQQNLYNRSSFSQKRHNKHPLVERSLTFQSAPSCVWPPLPAMARPPPSVLTWAFVTFSSPQSWAPTLVSRTQMYTRIVGGTHILRMDSKLSFPDLQIRRMQDARDARSVAKARAIVSSPSGADDCARAFYLFIHNLFLTHPFSRDSGFRAGPRTPVSECADSSSLLTY